MYYVYSRQYRIIFNWCISIIIVITIWVGLTGWGVMGELYLACRRGTLVLAVVVIALVLALLCLWC